MTIMCVCHIMTNAHDSWKLFATSSQPGFPTSFQLVRLCGLRPLGIRFYRCTLLKHWSTNVGQKDQWMVDKDKQEAKLSL